MANAPKHGNAECRKCRWRESKDSEICRPLMPNSRKEKMTSLKFFFNRDGDCLLFSKDLLWPFRK